MTKIYTNRRVSNEQMAKKKRSWCTMQAYTWLFARVYDECTQQCMLELRLEKPCCLLFINCPTLLVGGNTFLLFIFPPSFLLLSWYLRCFCGWMSCLVWACYHTRVRRPPRPSQGLGLWVLRNKLN